jgi:hypothetical protein
MPGLLSGVLAGIMAAAVPAIPHVSLAQGRSSTTSPSGLSTTSPSGMPTVAATTRPPAGPSAMASSGGWQRIQPQPVTTNGKRYTPTCSDAPGSKPGYAYFYRRGTAPGLVVFFNGGGACWNAATCSKPRLAGDRATFSGDNDQDASGVYKAELLPGDGPARMGGIFDLNNRQNPVRHWSMLFVPYCTGDVHSGSNTATYIDPATGTPFTIQHRGWDNMQVIMSWMRTHVPEPSRLLVSGSSAGAYGAASHYASLRALYPNARATFLGDSGQGVTNPAFEQARNKNWNYQLPVKVFGPNAQQTPDAEVVSKLAMFFANDRFAQFSTIHDSVQTAFFAQMGTAQACAAWTNKMLEELTVRQQASNFRSYIAAGNTHTILRAPLFYSEASSGVPFSVWLGELLTSASLPANQSCPSCKTGQQGCSHSP